jgi:hypothetical protein
MRRSIEMSQMGGYPMKIKVQLVLCAEDGREEQVQEIAVLEKPHQRIEHLGFTLAEAKSRYWYGERISTGFVESIVN